MKAIYALLTILLSMSLIGCDDSSSSKGSGDGFVPVNKEDSVQKSIPSSVPSEANGAVMQQATQQIFLLSETLEEGCDNNETCSTANDGMSFGQDDFVASAQMVKPSVLAQIPAFTTAQVIDATNNNETLMDEIIREFSQCEFNQTGSEDVSEDGSKFNKSNAVKTVGACGVNYSNTMDMNGVVGNNKFKVKSAQSESVRVNDAEWKHVFNIVDYKRAIKVNINANQNGFKMSTMVTIDVNQDDGGSYTMKISMRGQGKVDGNGEPIESSQGAVLAVLFEHSSFVMGGEVISQGPDNVVYKVNKKTVSKKEFEKYFGDVDSEEVGMGNWDQF